MTDKHINILPSVGTMHGFMKTTQHGEGRSVQSYDSGLRPVNDFKAHLQSAHDYMTAHGYEKTGSKSSHSTQMYRGATHTHSIHTYKHPDGKTGTISTTERHGTIPMGSVNIKADHINH